MDVQRAADGVAVGEVGVELDCCIVDVGVRGAAQLELAARLERDATNRAGVAEADRVVTIVEIVPAGSGLDAFEQRADAIVALVLDRTERGLPVDVLFVLGTDAPLGFRLTATGQRMNEI